MQYPCFLLYVVPLISFLSHSKFDLKYLFWFVPSSKFTKFSFFRNWTFQLSILYHNYCLNVFVLLFLYNNIFLCFCNLIFKVLNLFVIILNLHKIFFLLHNIFLLRFTELLYLILSLFKHLLQLNQSGFLCFYSQILPIELLF